jgi:large subunit ribosomal protein L17
MRHGDKINNLGRKKAHREALLSNLASQLIANKRITTTLAKAKVLRTYVEPLITKAKENTTHQRRIVFSYLQDKEAIKELFDVVRLKVEGRPGGYTRIIKLGARVGDNAELALIELVDYNDVYGKGTAAAAETTTKEHVVPAVAEKQQALRKYRSCLLQLTFLLQPDATADQAVIVNNLRRKSCGIMVQSNKITEGKVVMTLPFFCA